MYIINNNLNTLINSTQKLFILFQNNSKKCYIGCSIKNSLKDVSLQYTPKIKVKMHL